MSRLLRGFRPIPDGTRIRFMRLRVIALAVSLAIVAIASASIGFKGLNLGLDFVGGLLIEARTAQPVDLNELRPKFDALGLGAVSLQTFGDPHSLLIKVQADESAPAARQQAIEKIRSVLAPTDEVRRTEFVGPKVSGELLRDGVYAALLSVICIGVYVWFRFEWQFGIAAIAATFHDIIVTVGLFSLLGLEFDLTTIAALLTIAGYSINDTVVVFDRVRENLRQYKTMPLAELIDLSTNQTLARTILTSGTTLIAVVTLLLFGGPVLRNFAIALTWGILIGTYSSVFVANALLLYMPSVRREAQAPADDTTAGAA
ncbi:MAG: protein translocase subunit SecF [Rhodospirillaceae bacterium]